MPLRFPILLATAAALLAPFSSLAALLLTPVVIAALWRGWPSSGGTHGLPWPMIAWLLWLPATLAWSQSPGLALPQAAVLLCLPLGWLAGGALRGRGQLTRLLEQGLPGLLALLLVWGLLQGPNTFTAKPQGPFNDPNTYAAVLNILVLPVLARYLAADLARLASWRRVGQLALLAATAFVAFLTASRGAALALLLVLPPLLWLARKQIDFMRKLSLLAAVVACAYLAAYLVGGGANVGQRLVNTVSGGDPSRLMLMKSAWLMIQDHPWLGTGLGTFRLLYPQYRFPDESGTAGGWVHNDYLQLWLEAGLPMLLLMLGLVGWVGWRMWRALRESGAAADDAVLERMGYLAAIAAILLHALVNFLFFFSLVSLLVGLYLTRLAPPLLQRGRHDTTSSKHLRAIRLASGGYALILGWLLLGQVAVEGLLGQAIYIQRALLKLDVAYPRYQVAYWASVLAPFHPIPQQVMGLELADTGLFSGGDSLMRDEALARMDAAWRRAPCYLPYANDALALIQQGPLDAALRARGQAIVERGLACNSRHGLSYYHAGRLAMSDADALEWWRAGMAASPYVGDDLLFTAAILSRTTPGQTQPISALAEQMAQALRTLEANPGTHPDQTFWTDVQHKLYRLAGKRYLEFVPPPTSN